MDDGQQLIFLLIFLLSVVSIGYGQVKCREGRLGLV